MWQSQTCALDKDHERIVALTCMQATHVQGWELMNNGKCLYDIKTLIISANACKNNAEFSATDLDSEFGKASDDTGNVGFTKDFDCYYFEIWWNENHEDITEVVGCDPKDKKTLTKLESWAVSGEKKCKKNVLFGKHYISKGCRCFELHDEILA